jgi:hypothetical protein
MSHSLPQRALCLLALSFLFPIAIRTAHGQASGGATSAASSSSASGPGASAGSGGSASIEPQLMAYAALQELGARTCTNVISAKNGASANAGQGVLILDVPLGTQLTNFYACRAQWEYLHGNS